MVERTMAMVQQAFSRPAVQAPRREKRRAMFVVQHAPLWPSLATVYAAFASDPSWETVVVGMPFLHPDYVSDAQRMAVFDFLREQGIPHVRWDEFPLEADGADVVFLQNPYEGIRPAGWQVPDFVRLGLRLAYVPYCFEMASDAPTRQFDFPLHRSAWAVFAWSRAHRAMFARHCKAGDAHVILTGHPKLDLVRDLDRQRDPELERFKAGRKAVLWTPHFNIEPDGSGYSTFHLWHDFLLTEMTRRQDMVFIIRPHPLFFVTLEHDARFGKAALEGFSRRCAAAGNIHLDSRASYLPAFAAADAMISDLSTLLLEFTATGRRVLYLRNPRGPEMRAEMAGCDAIPAAETQPQIAAFIEKVAAGIDLDAEQRRERRQDALHMPPEGAGVAVKRAIETKLAGEAAARAA